MRFSRRSAVAASPNRIAAETHRLRASGRRLLDLTQSNPTDAGLVYPWEQIKEALTREQILTYQASSNGILEARQAVSSYLRGSVHAERILLTASTSEAYSYLFKLLCNPGESILAPRPSYPLLDVLARLESVAVTQYSLRYDFGWRIDFDSLRAAVRGTAARAVLFVNPNNPTGSYLTQDDAITLVDLCQENNLALICDEVFSDYALQADSAGICSLAGCETILTFALSGLSKVCALPQLKLAWIAASGPSPAIEEAMERLEWIADSFLSPGAPVQWAAPRLLDLRHSLQHQISQRTRRNLDALARRTENTPASVLKADGGWYATLKVPRVRSEEEWVVELLQRHAVLVQPGYFFDFETEAYLVVSLLTEPDIFDQGLTSVLQLMNEQ